MAYVLVNADNNAIIEVFSEIAPVFKYILQRNPSCSVYVDMVKENKIYVHSSFAVAGGHGLEPKYIIISTKIKN